MSRVERIKRKADKDIKRIKLNATKIAEIDNCKNNIKQLRREAWSIFIGRCDKRYNKMERKQLLDNRLNAIKEERQKIKQYKSEMEK